MAVIRLPGQGGPSPGPGTPPGASGNAPPSSKSPRQSLVSPGREDEVREVQSFFLNTFFFFLRLHLSRKTKIKSFGEKGGKIHKDAQYSPPAARARVTSPQLPCPRTICLSVCLSVCLSLLSSLPHLPPGHSQKGQEHPCPGSKRPVSLESGSK